MKMEIVRKKETKTVPLADVYFGACFLDEDGALHYKTNEVHHSGKVICIHFETADTCLYSQEDEVTPVETTLNVKE